MNCVASPTDNRLLGSRSSWDGCGIKFSFLFYQGCKNAEKTAVASEGAAREEGSNSGPFHAEQEFDVETNFT